MTLRSAMCALPFTRLVVSGTHRALLEIIPQRQIFYKIYKITFDNILFDTKIHF